jgi:hypothetical protein
MRHTPHHVAPRHTQIPSHRPERRHVRLTLAVLAATTLLVAPAAGTASAAPASRSATLSEGRARVETPRHVASLRDAARHATGIPRRLTAQTDALRSVRTTAKPSSGGLVRSGAAQPTPRSAVSPQDVATPDAEILQQFAGLTQADAGGADPPDPWIAVSSSYVVQSVTGKIRIWNRAGVEQATVTTWAFLSLPLDQAPSNLRIIWDATHSRWLASAVSVNADSSDNFLYLAVSDGANPTAGWRVFPVSYGDQLPDYPAIASSNDKVVITDNLFDATDTAVGADLTTWTWASLLAGGTPTPAECTTDDSRFNARPGQVLSSATDVHLIMEEVPSGEQWYYRLTGTGACDTDIVDETHLSLLKPFAVPPAPRQLTGDTITNAADERPTDAIWQNGKLYWVSTYPWSYDGGATFNSAVVIWNVTTTASGSPVNPGAQALANGDGFDSFVGGIGLSRGGTLFTLYSQSSSTNYPYLLADQAQPGQYAISPIEVDYGDAAAASERYGGFAGVAMDPVGTGTVWATHQVPALDGTWRTDVVRLAYDAAAPTNPGTPTTTFTTSTTVGSSVTTTVSWTASTDSGTGVQQYDVWESKDGAGYVSLGSQTTTSISRTLLFNHTYRYKVRAMDVAGNVTADVVGPTVKPTIAQTAAASGYSTGWGTTTNTSYSGGSTRYATKAGASVTYSTTGARSIAIVTTKAATRGSFKVYVDGVYKTTISTYSTTTRYRQLVYRFSWSSPGTHKIKIVVVGTSGHPRVDADAFVVLR